MIIANKIIIQMTIINIIIPYTSYSVWIPTVRQKTGCKQIKLSKMFIPLSSCYIGTLCPMQNSYRFKQAIRDSEWILYLLSRAYSFAPCARTRREREKPPSGCIAALSPGTARFRSQGKMELMRTEKSYS